MRMSHLLAFTMIVVVSIVPLAVRAADEQGLPDAGAEASPGAQQCLADLRAFEAELANVGFGVLAPGGYDAASPGYGAYYGVAATPRQKMQVLRDAAYVYALDGDEQACETVLASMRQVYEEHQELVGIENDDPNARAAWRRAHLAQASPVTKMNRMMRADVIIGADIRTPEDETLGEIEDIVLDPARQTIAYVLASRGGLLGLGEELVAVRWTDLRATADHEIYVLEASPEAFAAAPKAERGSFEESGDNGWRDTLDQYWAGVVRTP